MSYDDDFEEDGTYLNDSKPGVGTYSQSYNECRNCSDRALCRSETSYNYDDEDFKHRSYGVKKNRIPYRKIASSQQRSPRKVVELAVSHSDFVPFHGETETVRLVKNVLLNCGESTALTLAGFFRNYKWAPKPKVVITQCENTENEDDDEEY